MPDISQISAEYKLAKATAALEHLIELTARTPAVKMGEAWVEANSILAVLKGVETMPEFWVVEDHHDADAEPKADQ